MLDQKFLDLVSRFLDGALEHSEIRELCNELRDNERRRSMFREHLLVHAAVCRRLGNEAPVRACMSLAASDLASLNVARLNRFTESIGARAAVPVAVKTGFDRQAGPGDADDGTVVPMAGSSSRFLKFGLGLAAVAAVGFAAFSLLETGNPGQPEAFAETGSPSDFPGSPAVEQASGQDDAFLALGNLRNRKPDQAAPGSAAPDVRRAGYVDDYEPWEEGDTPVFATLDTDFEDPLDGNPFDPKVLRKSSGSGVLGDFLLTSGESAGGGGGSESLPVSLRLKP